MPSQLTIRAFVWRHAPRLGFFLGVSAFLWVATRSVPWAAANENPLKGVELLTRIVAFGAATVFIAYRVFAGFFVANLDLGLAVERVPLSGSPLDALIVRVVASKGSHGTLVLRHAHARVEQKLPDGTWEQRQSKELEGTCRLRTDLLKSLTWRKNAGRPELLLAPGDRMQFAIDFEVPRDSFCRVQVLVACKTPVNLRSAQWRATEYSVPAVAAQTHQPTA